MKFIFCMQINNEVFYKLILSFWVNVTRHVTPKVCISLLYLHKSMGEVDFLPADKHKSFLQDDNITLGVLSQACPKYPKQ